MELSGFNSLGSVQIYFSSDIVSLYYGNFMSFYVKPLVLIIFLFEAILFEFLYMVYFYDQGTSEGCPVLPPTLEVDLLGTVK